MFIGYLSFKTLFKTPNSIFRPGIFINSCIFLFLFPVNKGDTTTFVYFFAFLNFEPSAIHWSYNLHKDSKV